MTDDPLNRIPGVNRLSIALEKLGVTDVTSPPLIYRLLDDILDIASLSFDTELAQATKDKMTETKNRSDAGILLTRKELEEFAQNFWNNIESLPITEEAI